MRHHAATRRPARHRRRRGLLAAAPAITAAAFGLLGTAAPASAQTAPPGGGAFPSRPVRVLIGFAPGGATDIMARTMQPAMADHLGQPLVIENRPGASGMIATQELVRSAPDGHTIGWLSSAHAGMAAIQQRAMPYDAVRDIAHVSLVAHMPAVVAVPAASPVRTMQDLVALARATPGGLSYSTSGPGGWQQFGVTDFGRRLGLTLIHVPYRGGGPSIQALMAGEVAFSFATPASVHAAIQAGALRGIAVSGPERSPEWPDLPTVAEAVPLPGFRTVDWYAIAAPAGLPEDRRARLAAAIHAALARPDIAARLRTLGAVLAPSSPAEMEAFIRSEIVHYTGLAQATGIRAE
jgi:tripartite-type tricarboxylate transporter receptor subunit TctC